MADPLPPSAQALARRRIAAATRLIVERTLSNQAPAEVLQGAAAELEAVAGVLGEHGFGRRTEPRGAAEFVDNSPFAGLSNAIAAPMRVTVADGVVHGAVRYGGAYEGPPGCLHGGYIAALHDEILGMANGLGGAPGMTGTLTIRYRVPTPLWTDLRLEGRLDRSEGRKQWCTSELWAGDVLCNEAEGLFITSRDGPSRLVDDRDRLG